MHPGENIYRKICAFCLALIAVSLPLSKFMITSASGILIVNWLVEGNFREKWRLFRVRPSIAVLTGFFLLHLIAISWSPDLRAGLTDVRVKIPLFALPLIIGTSAPLDKRIFEFILVCFTAGTFISTVSTILIATGIIPKHIDDLRDASVFVPLIRLSLMSVFSIFLLGRWMMRQKSMYVTIGALALTGWLTWFMLYMQSLTGIVILFAGGFIVLLFMAFFSRKRKFVLLLLLGFFMALFTGFFQVKKMYDDFYTFHPADRSHLAVFTSRGHLYTYKLNSPMVENGYQVLSYVCWPELDSAWDTRSRILLNGGKDADGNPIAYTLVRYLASKGWRKDADAVAQLSNEEIHAIENGETNVRNAQRTSFEKRVYQVIWELYHYYHGGNPSGNSVTMRIELSGTAITCINRHPWKGAGTGGMEHAFNEWYDMHGTKLGEDFQWLHAHNQFLSVAVTLGIPALLFFIFSLYYAPASMSRWKNYLYLAFFVVIFFSFFDDDTLETQQGVTLYAFFNALLLYAMPHASAVKDEKKLPGSVS